MTRSEAGRLGQAALRRKLGDSYNDHMAELGKLGFQATIVALAGRQTIEPRTPGVNPFRHLLRNLKNRKGGVKC